MKPETIKAIFTNVLFVIGILLTIYGFSRGALTLVRLAVFDKYPLQSYEETRCEMDLYVSKPIIDDKSQVQLTAGEIEDRKNKCLIGLESDRKNRMVEDITGSITALFAGIALAYAFRRFIFK